MSKKHKNLQKKKLTFDEGGYLTPQERKRLDRSHSCIISPEEKEKLISEGHWVRGSQDVFFRDENSQS